MARSSDVGAEDRGAWDLPRCGALDPWSLRQGPWSALALPYGDGPNSACSTALGLALSDGLCASQPWSIERGRSHKKLTDWAWQAILLTKRWLANGVAGALFSHHNLAQHLGRIISMH